MSNTWFICFCGAAKLLYPRSIILFSKQNVFMLYKHATRVRTSKKDTHTVRVLFQNGTNEVSVVLVIKTNKVSFYNSVLTSVKCL